MAQELEVNAESNTASRIDSITSMVRQEQRYTHQLDTNAFFNLPVGIMAEGQDPAYALVITEVMLTSDMAYFSACMQLINPTDGSKLAFEAHHIPFSYTHGLAGPFHLTLVEDVSCPFSKDIRLTILSGSWVEADCKGFICLGLKGRVSLSKELFIPVNEQGESLTGEIESFFEVTATNWNDLIFAVSLDPFCIKGFPDISFQFDHLGVDFSDLRNLSEIKYPDGYQQPENEINPMLWRGLFAAEAKVRLGKAFAKRGGETISFAAQNLLIDEQGFSGNLTASGLLGEGEGSMDGWDFSVTRFMASFMRNCLVAGGFDGYIHIPALGADGRMAYQAVFDKQGNYSFSVHPADSFSFELFGASRMTLSRSSTIIVQKLDGHFCPKALLTGELSFSCPLNEKTGSSKFKLDGIRFQDLCLSTRPPYLEVTYLETNGDNSTSLSNFPLTIEKIGLSCFEQKLVLSIKTNINLLESSEEGFSGKSELRVSSHYDGNKFHFDGIDIGAIEIAFGKPKCYALAGKIEFVRNDPVYGDGFSGALKMEINDLFSAEAKVRFGQVDKFRYYYADAFFIKESGIQAGSLTIFGAGGGIYHHMRQEKTQSNSPDQVPNPSGINYVPDKNLSLGLKFGLNFGLVKKSILLANAGFEISFNHSGGINRVGFDGTALCLSQEIPLAKSELLNNVSKLAGGGKIDKLPAAAVSAIMNLEMDFVTHAFHGELQVYVNVAGAITGTGPAGRAGWAVVHVDKDEWYLCIGTPENPIGLQFAGIAKTGSYLMAGHRIPEGLPMNEQVVRILQLSPEDFCEARNPSMLKNGRGFAFGTNFEISINEEFAFVYGVFRLGAGFDLLLNDLGAASYCAGRKPPLGINGWYAKGQVYAFLEGKVGIILTLFEQKKKFDVLNLSAAALLRGEGPNPMWINGTVGGSFALMGGLVSGKCRFELNVGEKCRIVRPQGEEHPLRFIGDLSPGDKLKEVDPGALPQAVFNLPVNKIMPLVDDEGFSHRFRINLLSVRLSSSGKPIAGILKWNADQDLLLFNPDEMLDAHTTYEFTVRVSFEEFLNGKWVSDNGQGSVQEEQKKCVFTTGSLPKEIPANELANSYPVNRQRYFLPREHNQGHIRFTQGKTAYFNNAKYACYIRFIPIPSGEPIRKELNYNSSEHSVYFDIPEELGSGKIYRLEIVSVSKTDDSQDQPAESFTRFVTDDPQDSMVIRNRTISSVLVEKAENVIFQYYFRTSRYGTFREKMSIAELPVNFLYDISPYVNLLGASWSCPEPFDKADISGSGGNSPLVRPVAYLQETPCFNNSVNPILYQGYPYQGIASITSRTAEPVGIPPFRDIQIWQKEYNGVLTEEECQCGQLEEEAMQVHFMYAIPYYWCRDYTDMRSSLAQSANLTQKADSRISSILKNPLWPLPTAGTYPVLFEYFIPGQIKCNSSCLVKLQNPFTQDTPRLY